MGANRILLLFCFLLAKFFGQLNDISIQQLRETKGLEIKLYTFNLIGDRFSIINDSLNLVPDHLELSKPEGIGRNLDSFLLELKNGSPDDAYYDCFFPQYAIVFYNAQKQIIAYVDVSFSCEAVQSNIVDLKQEDVTFYYSVFPQYLLDRHWGGYNVDPTSQLSWSQTMAYFEQCAKKHINQFLYKSFKMPVPVLTYQKCEFLLYDQEYQSAILTDTLVKFDVKSDSSRIIVIRKRGGGYILDFKGNVVSSFQKMP